jgi:hypothetical protein
MRLEDHAWHAIDPRRPVAEKMCLEAFDVDLNITTPGDEEGRAGPLCLPAIRRRGASDRRTCVPKLRRLFPSNLKRGAVARLPPLR